MRALSQRERRLVAGGLLVAVVAGLVNLVVVPLVSGFSTRAAERERLALEYRHLDQTIANLPRLRRQARAEEDGQRRFVVTARTPDLAGLALEERLRTTIEAVGGEYRTIEHDAVMGDPAAKPGANAANRGLIRARATARIPLAALTRLLERLQNETPMLTVGVLNLAADAALATQQSEPLDVKLEVTVPFAPAAS